MLRFVLLKVWLALVPSAVMAVMQTTMMRASMTAYSTAVGPSPSRTNWRAFSNNLYMHNTPSVPGPAAPEGGARRTVLFQTSEVTWWEARHRPNDPER